MPCLLPVDTATGRHSSIWSCHCCNTLHRTRDKADGQADERVGRHKVELRLGLRAPGGLPGSGRGRGALAVQAVDDRELRKVAEEALGQVITLCTRQ